MENKLKGLIFGYYIGNLLGFKELVPEDALELTQKKLEISLMTCMGIAKTFLKEGNHESFFENAFDVYIQHKDKINDTDLLERLNAGSRYTLKNRLNIGKNKISIGPISRVWCYSVLPPKYALSSAVYEAASQATHLESLIYAGLYADLLSRAFIAGELTLEILALSRDEFYKFSFPEKKDPKFPLNEEKEIKTYLLSFLSVVYYVDTLLPVYQGLDECFNPNTQELTCEEIITSALYMYFKWKKNKEDLDELLHYLMHSKGGWESTGVFLSFVGIDMGYDDLKSHFKDEVFDGTTLDQIEKILIKTKSLVEDNRNE